MSCSYSCEILYISSLVKTSLNVSSFLLCCIVAWNETLAWFLDLLGQQPSSSEESKMVCCSRSRETLARSGSWSCERVCSYPSWPSVWTVRECPHSCGWRRALGFGQLLFKRVGSDFFFFSLDWLLRIYSLSLNIPSHGLDFF